jgi:hypothetical protein
LIGNSALVPYDGLDALHLEEVNSTSLLVRTLLKDLCPELVGTAEANFKIVRYFPISALGGSPEAQGTLLKVQPEKIIPYRVTEPMLWLMQRWGLVFGLKTVKENPGGFPVAKIREASADQLLAIMPSGEHLSLDYEYAGSSILDPQLRRRVWIPNVAPPKARTPQPPPMKSPPNFGLTLDDPPPPDKPQKPHKKRWFGGE